MTEIKNQELHQIMTEDGRRGEKHVMDTGNEKITEIYLQSKVPMTLATRIREEKQQMICKRTTERFDDAGKIIEQIVESLPEDAPIKVVDHIISTTTPPTVYATKEDIEEIKEAIQNTKKPTIMAQGLLADRLSKMNREAVLTTSLWSIFAVEAIVLGYIVFFK